MTLPAHHGWSHRLKDEGGADPVDFVLPYIYGHNDGLGQTVTDDDELDLSFVRTNDRRTFRWDEADDPNGLVIIRSGIYQCWINVKYAVGSIAVPRLIYPGFSLFSGGPLSGLGTEFGQDHFQVGNGQNQAGIGEVSSSSTISKSSLAHMSMQPVLGFDFEEDPPRIAAILQHVGTNYTLNSGLKSSITLIRVGGLGSEPPEPDITPP